MFRDKKRATLGVFNRMNKRPLALLAAPALVLVVRAATFAAEPTKPVDFAGEIAPIFEAHCVRCHNATEKKGKFSLATAAEFFEPHKGKTVVVRGDADASLLVESITPQQGEEPEMPKEGNPLTAAQVTLIRRWIADGAKWPDGAIIRQKTKADKTWWSLQPLRDHGAATLLSPHEPNRVARVVAAGGADREATEVSPLFESPIDRFVFAKLTEKGLRPSPPAEPREFIRRATYDLTGLPPTPEEVDAFETESIRDPQSATRNLIDRLLASPRYGEHWGRHWLDVVRFGESSGFERNLVRDNAWQFRDYVIRSLNDDKPFDRFMMEHIAGDQLAPDDPQVEVGVAFLVAGPYDDVNNQDAKAAAQIRANTLDDIVTATGSAFLGLTTNCARCHDHKFDPIEQADYYRLQAAFAGVQQGASALASAEEKRALAEKRKPLDAALADVQRELDTIKSDAAKSVAARRDELLAELPRLPVAIDGAEEKFTPVEARFVRMTFASPTEKIQVLVEECEVWSPGDKPRNVALAANGATITARGTRKSDVNPDAYAPEHLIDGNFDTAWIGLGSGAAPPQFTIGFAQPETIARVAWTQDHRRARRTTLIETYTIEVSLDGEHWKKVADNEGRRPASKELLEAKLSELAMEPETRERWHSLTARKTDLNAQIEKLPKLPAAWVGKHEQPKARTYLMRGGDPQKRGSDIAPASLHVLDEVTRGYELPLDAPEGERRLALARWLVADDNPLTPRVLANRVWHYHFGTGIVDTPSDFGYMGGRPTHPELLDYLASRLKHHGWRLKPLHREIMLSQAYRQSSAWRKDGADADFAARLLWRFPPRRLSAEELRDTMLAAADKLDLRMGGPGFRLYRYLNDNVSTYTPLDQVGPETYRRAVYHQNARASTIDLMSDFDAPDCAFSTPRRASTTTPLQALTLLNHSFTLDMSRALAGRLHAEAGEDPAAQAGRAFALCYGRAASDEEIEAARNLINAHGLPAFCRALFNSNELLYVH
jgi:mono/diheme cytochrome c family protein